MGNENVNEKMRESLYRKPIARYISGVITCFLVLCIFIAKYDDAEKFFKHAHKFEGKVLEVNKIKRGYRIKVEYLSTESEMKVKRKKHVGDSIDVYVNYFYNRKGHSKVRTAYDKNTVFDKYGIYFIGAVIVIGILKLILNLAHNIRRKYIIKKGKRIYARIIKIDDDKVIYGKNIERHLYRIHCEYRDCFNGMRYEFTTRLISKPDKLIENNEICICVGRNYANYVIIENDIKVNEEF